MKEISNKEWCNLENTELVGSLENNHVVGLYNGVMFEAIPDKSENNQCWKWVPLNR